MLQVDHPRPSNMGYEAYAMLQEAFNETLGMVVC